MTFESYIDKAFWALLLGVCTYGSNQANKIVDSIQAIKVAVVEISAKGSMHEFRIIAVEESAKQCLENIRSLDGRIYVLEKSVK